MQWNVTQLFDTIMWKDNAIHLSMCSFSMRGLCKFPVMRWWGLADLHNINIKGFLLLGWFVEP